MILQQPPVPHTTMLRLDLTSQVWPNLLLQAVSLSSLVWLTRRPAPTGLEMQDTHTVLAAPGHSYNRTSPILFIGTMGEKW